MNSWLIQLLQTNDSVFPTGAYAHSFGLEGAVQVGLVSDADSLREFVSRHIVPSLEHFELPTVRLAFESVGAGDFEALCRLDRRYAAMKGSREQRFASERIGCQKLAVLLETFDHPVLRAIDELRRDGSLDCHAPIIGGVHAVAAEMPVETALMAAYYQGLASVIMASMKLIRIGQSACQRMLADFMLEGESVVSRSMKIDDAEVGWFSPAVDIVSAQHETAYSRLFIS